ncbi:GNAT family N-acetyltransferase (plasmid) [Haladaptatus sp. SPP-AMP-3]|uniref:GNAT family N-acetyltransferase n=1 Tax=Haladaptatus sp. SPP-AMP-3 TaxID=3121295 RepID=UPI003C2B8A77
MNDAVPIRGAREDDAAAIQRVARASWHAAYDDVMGAEAVEETVDSWFAVENVVADVNRDERPFFVAERKGTVVGFVIGIPDGEREAGFHLYRIYVHPDHWGAGVGTRLLDRFEAELRGQNVMRLQLSAIGPNENAIGFYEARGFERIVENWDDDFDCERYVYDKEL